MSFRVYCDGSGTTGGPAGVAFVAYDDQGEWFGEDSLPLANATNQQAELLAAAYALHTLPEDLDVVIVSDSQYVVLGMNENRRRKKNLSHWARLERAVARHHSVTFEWTRGHVGTLGNERADELARQARQAALAEV